MRQSTIAVLAFRVLPFLSACILFQPMNALADDRTADPLHPLDRTTLRFGLTDEISSYRARATVLIQGNGYQPLHPGARLSVNGYTLEEKPLSGHGVWYVGEVPMTGRYELLLTLGDGREWARAVLSSRSFEVALPRRVSRGQGLVLVRGSGKLTSSDRIVLEIEPRGQTMRPRFLTLKPQIDRLDLVFPAADLARLPLGPADLSLALHQSESTEGKIVMRYAAFLRTRIEVTD